MNGEWRMVDCSLASPTHPSRPPPATKSFESFYFLARPSEFLYTHIPLGDHLHQHVLAQDIISPPVQLALPYACPAYFQYDLCLQSDYDYSQTRLDGLQVACVDVEVHEDVECVAEVESQAYARDLEGDLFESGEVIKEAALAQALWLDDGQRRVYRIKAFLRGEGVKGTLKVYAGKKGLMVLLFILELLILDICPRQSPSTGINDTVGSFRNKSAIHIRYKTSYPSRTTTRPVHSSTSM